jgi:DNA-binding winged helix-turn-helix (wHTH) protein
MALRKRAAGGAKTVRVGETALAREFFAGQYGKVVGATFDARTTTFEDVDVAFAVGSLTFLGRIEDAEMCFDAWRLRTPVHDLRTMAASRFFLGVAHARAGNFARAHELLVQKVRHYLRGGDAWAAALAFQGLACQRYFTGRYGAAARHALRALRAAHTANFAYAKMLSTDLRGHALVQIGRLRAGVDLLEQAKSHAEHLGFGLNAYAVACSIATYTPKFMAGDEVIHQIEELLARRSHDSYSRHNLLTELAGALALRGHKTEAVRAMDQADQLALKVDARRAKVRSLLARLHVTRWSAGAAACGDLLAQTAELIDEADLTFRAELLGFEGYVAKASHDAARLTRAEGALRTLASSHESHWARAALEQLGAGPDRTRAFPEDELTPMLRAVDAHDERMLPRLLSHGLLGAVPELLGLVPGRRIIILSAEHAIFLEDQGDMALRPSPPRWCPALLRLLATGDVSKEVIVTKLWGLRSYRPERHDPLVRTTIHRLRTFLKPRGDWVRVTEHGYEVTVPVISVGSDDVETAELEIPLPEEEAPLEVSTRRAPRALAIAESPNDRFYAMLGQLGSASVGELADALGVSDSTALRALRELVAEKKVLRSGFARATRYRPRDLSARDDAGLR